eukprot:TRINITY_DN8853_c1_g1_i1.p1 TRINITY_DN8853_c1_g1~~TRINITY_DN8853_c1_g1_i1.p1  ORF type:complete len:980 (-),score=262.60 TRINITY_DN8853_c1_g1_i1:149-3088(-)
MHTAMSARWPGNLDRLQQLAASATGFANAGLGDIGYCQRELQERAEREARERQRLIEEKRETERRREQERIDAQKRAEEQKRLQELKRLEDLQRQEDQRLEQEREKARAEAEERAAAAERLEAQKMPEPAQKKPETAHASAKDTVSDDWELDEDELDDDFEVPDLDVLHVDDVIIVREDFFSDSEDGEELLRGQRGTIVEIDPDGDAYVRFREHRKKQWVYSQNFALIAKVLFNDGDRIVVCRSFPCGPVKLKKGQEGKVKRVDPSGDVFVDFDGIGDHWVQYYSLVFMSKKLTPPKPAPSRANPKMEATDARMWLYNPKEYRQAAIRVNPSIEGPRTDILMRPGQRFMVSEEHIGSDGILYLRLADGSGWMFESNHRGVLCVRQGGGLPQSVLGSSCNAEADAEPDTILDLDEAKHFLGAMNGVLSSKAFRASTESLFDGARKASAGKSEAEQARHQELMAEKAKRIFIDACKSLLVHFGFEVSPDGQDEMLEAIREHQQDDTVFVLATVIEMSLFLDAGSWFGMSQLRKGCEVTVIEHELSCDMAGQRGTLQELDKEGQWRVRLQGIDEVKAFRPDQLALVPDVAQMQALKTAAKEQQKVIERTKESNEEKRSSQEEPEILKISKTSKANSAAEMAEKARSYAALGAARLSEKTRSPAVKAPWWVTASSNASARATAKVLEREFLALTSGSEEAFSIAIMQEAQENRARSFQAIQDGTVDDSKPMSLFNILEQIDQQEECDAIRKEFKSLARRRRKPAKVEEVADTIAVGQGGSTSSTSTPDATGRRRRGAFSKCASALAPEKPEKDDDDDDEEEYEEDEPVPDDAFEEPYDIRKILAHKDVIGPRKDALLLHMTGEFDDDNPGILAVEERNEELPPRLTRAEAAREEFERQRARWKLEPRGKHVGYMPQAHELGAGKGNLGAVEESAAAPPPMRVARPAPQEQQSMAFGGLPDFDSGPGTFGGFRSTGGDRFLSFG